jgi:hypothetical protein
MADMEALKSYYRIVKQPKGGYHFYCKKCSKAWSLPHEPNVGTILKLLDHGHSHKSHKEDK